MSPVITLLLVALLVALMITAPIPVSDWRWDTVPGGSAIMLITIVVVVLFLNRP